MQFGLLIVLSLVTLFLVGCSGNPEKIYKKPPVTPEYAVKVNWANKFNTLGVDKFARLLPAVASEGILVADTLGGLSLLDRNSGKSIWQKKFDTIFSGGPSVFDEAAYIGTRNAEILSVSTKDGSLIWKQRVSSEVLATPQKSGDVVIVQTNDGKVFGLSETDGSKIWIFERNVPVLSVRGNSVPVVVDNVVYVGFANGLLVALAAADGKLLWDTAVAIPRGRTELERMVDIDAPIVYRNGVLYVAAYRGKIAAIQAVSGRINWTREISSFNGVSIDDSLLYATSSEGQVWALSLENGATLWMQDKLEQLAHTRPAVLEKEIVVGDVLGELYWLSKTDGRILGHLAHDVVSEMSGATDYVNSTNSEGYFTPLRIETAVTFRPQIVGDSMLVSYQNGIIASVSMKNKMNIDATSGKSNVVQSSLKVISANN